MPNNTIFAFKHSGQLGDIVYSLPFIKSFLLSNNASHAFILIPNDKKSNHAKGLKHLDDVFMINQSMFDFIFPLLKNIDFVANVFFLPEHKIPNNVVDLDLVRNGNINLSAGNIKSYYFKQFGLIDCCNGPWLENIQQSTELFDIIIGRSTRYLNTSINYDILNYFSANIGFIGTDQEFNNFNSFFPNLRINRIHVQSALNAAELIKNTKLFIGNQSLFFAIAEALNHPRLLECFEPVPNVVPLPGNSGAFLNSTNFFKLVCNFFEPFISPQIQDMPAAYVLSSHK